MVYSIKCTDFDIDRTKKKNKQKMVKKISESQVLVNSSRVFFGVCCWNAANVIVLTTESATDAQRDTRNGVEEKSTSADRIWCVKRKVICHCHIWSEIWIGIGIVCTRIQFLHRAIDFVRSFFPVTLFYFVWILCLLYFPGIQQIQLNRYGKSVK